jgi:hypothetical protein
MVGELDAGNPHVQFDEGALETCDSVTRLRPTLPRPLPILRSREYREALELDGTDSEDVSPIIGHYAAGD